MFKNVQKANAVLMKTNEGIQLYICRCTSFQS